MADEKRTFPFRYADPGVEGDHDIYPRLTAEGRIRLDDVDGDHILEFGARCFEHYLEMFKFGVTIAHTLNMGTLEENTTRLFTVRAIVTDARVAYTIFDGKAGQHIVGHVRYQWLEHVGFHPKQGLLLDPELKLQFRQDFPLADRGFWVHRIHLGFEKRIHPGNLAAEIVKRASRFRLDDGGAADAREEFERLSRMECLPEPVKKGEFASVDLPGAAGFPGFDYPASEVPSMRDIPSSPDLEPDAPPVLQAVNSLDAAPLVQTPSSSTGRVLATLPRIGVGDRLRAMRLVRRAQRDSAAGRDRKAAEQLDAVLAILDSHQPIMSTAWMVELIKMAAFAHSPHDPEVALERVESAIALTREHHEESLERAVRLAALEIVDGAPDHEFVLPNLRRLVALADILGTRAERAQARATLARHSRDHGHRSEAIEQLAVAAALFDDSDETWDAAMAFGELSDLYRKAGALAESRMALERARSGFEKAGDVKNLAVAVRHLDELDA